MVLLLLVAVQEAVQVAHRGMEVQEEMEQQAALTEEEVAVALVAAAVARTGRMALTKWVVLVVQEVTTQQGTAVGLRPPMEQ